MSIQRLRIAALCGFAALLPAEASPAQASPTQVSPAQVSPAQDNSAKEAVQNPETVDAAARRSSQAASGVLVVDILRAIDQYPRWIKLKGELEAMEQGFIDQLKQLAQRMDELRGTIQQMVPDTEERKQKEFELQMALQQQDFLNKMYRERLRSEELKANLVIYEDVEAAIEKVAKSRSALIVLRKYDIQPASEPVAKLSGKEVQARVLAFERRQVWFAADAIDVTGDVIKLLQVPLPKETTARENSSPGGRN
jgi:Skp family chaperone for outer membrane proteins